MIMMANSLLQKQNLSAQIFQIIKDLILNGELRPGERLLEAQLATELSVSRAPIREALLLLAQRGFVTISPRRGAFVTELSANDLKEIFEIRKLLEVDAAIKLQLRKSTEIALHLEKALEKMRRAAHERDLVQFTEADFNLHKTMWDLAGNAHASKMLMDIAARFFRYEQIRKTTLASNFDYTGIFDEHCRIVDRILHGNKQEVEDELGQHLEKFMHFAITHFVYQDPAGVTQKEMEPPPASSL